jgi:hypothetical protein
MLADLRARADRKGIDVVELLRCAASLERMLFEGDNEVVVRDRQTGQAAVLRLTEIADAG